MAGIYDGRGILRHEKTGDTPIFGPLSLLRAILEAGERGIKTIAFPSISTGAYGYPMADAARIALSTAMRYLSAHPGIALVRFVLFGEQALREYEAALADLAPDDPVEGS